MTRFILVSGGKGGVGKTTSAINIASALTYFGRDTTIIDGNLTTPNVGVHLGAPVVPIHLHHVLQGKHSIGEAIYEHPTGTKIIPASLSVEDLRLTDSTKLNNHIRKLKGYTDFVIIDCAAGLGREAFSALQPSEEVLIITNPELAAVTDALKTIKVVEDYKKKVLGVVVTKKSNLKTEMSIRNIELLLEKPVIGIIPEDKAIKESQAAKDPVVYSHPYSHSAIAYKKLAADLINQQYDPEADKPKQKFMIKLLKKLGF